MFLVDDNGIFLAYFVIRMYFVWFMVMQVLGWESALEKEICFGSSVLWLLLFYILCNFLLWE